VALYFADLKLIYRVFIVCSHSDAQVLENLLFMYTVNLVDMSLNNTDNMKVSFLALFCLYNDYFNITIQYNIT
jgi:hypothetical protein